MMEDPVLMPAAVSGNGVEEAAAQLDRLALDCMELAVELHVYSARLLMAILGTTPAGMIELMSKLDPTTVSDSGERALLETAMGMWADLETLLFKAAGPGGRRSGLFLRLGSVVAAGPPSSKSLRVKLADQGPWRFRELSRHPRF
jgi:hypothetical protein